MSVLPSMVHRSGDTLVVRSVVSGDPIYEDVFSSYASTITSNKLGFYIEDQKQQDRSQNHGDLNPQPETGADLPECKVKRNYSCSTCDYFTQNPRKYLYHLRDVHREKVKVYECPSCLYASKHYQKLLRHTRMVHGRNSTTSCTIQDKSNLKLSTSASTTSHTRRKRGGGIGAVVVKDDSINTCDETIPTSPRPVEEEEQDEEEEDDDEDVHNLEIDESIQEGRNETCNGKFRCALCSYVAKGQQQLTRHESEVHIRTKFFRCTKCSYVTHIKARYTKHVKYHSMPMIKCDLCDFRTPYKWNLDRHCKNHNGRGAFRCSACNFTADIKQSLTVHEMNHHVPPVGQAAMAAAAAAAAAVGAGASSGGGSTNSVLSSVLASGANVAGTNRRRNKVGASDSAFMENQVQAEEYQQPRQKTKTLTDILSYHNTSITSSTAPTAAYTSADFVHPDDIVERPNGHIYLKSQCKLCNFKTAYDAEMAKHERTHHSSSMSFPHVASSKAPRKTPRPVPKLIPLRSPSNMLSAKELHDIALGSTNSALKDYAPLFNSEHLFKPQQTSIQPVDPSFKEKNASFFDKLKEKLMCHDSSTDLVCQRCGHESKCLTENVSHLKMCGKEIDRLTDNDTPPLNNNNTSSVLSSTRCQYCRQRCKSSADLYNHMQTCSKYQQESDLLGEEEDDEEAEHMEIEMRPEDILSVEEQQHESGEMQQPHPMENRVFVWNDIEVPMNIDIDEVGPQHPQLSDYSSYYNNLMENANRQNGLAEEDDMDAVSLDLSIRTQSPVTGEATPPPSINTKPPKQSHQSQSTTNIFGKVPTHGNDISIAQHKRVFKCPHCSFWASTASRFHVHIVGHLNKKPFECSLCAYRSNWRWDITKHIKLKSVRDPNHESARVLMTDETGRRNYTKYNKYLTEINLQNGNADAINTSGGSSGSRTSNSKGQQQQVLEDISPSNSKQTKRPPPELKAANNNFNITVARFAAVTEMAAQGGQAVPEIRETNRKRPGDSNPNSEPRRPMYKCGKYTLKEEKPDFPTEPQYLSQSLVLSNTSTSNDTDAVDITCQPDMQQLLLPSVLPSANATGSPSSSSDGSCRSSPHGFGADDMIGGGGSAADHPLSLSSTARSASGSAAPFSCGHCHQRHCRLKHHGNISVIVGGRAGNPDRVESDRQPDEPEHLDMPQLGAHKCPHCPYSTDIATELVAHSVGHNPTDVSMDSGISDPNTGCCRCPICGYAVAHLAEMYAHLPLHGVADPVDYMHRSTESDPSKRHKCAACPYVTNSKSQYMYHKRFHKPKNGPYKCSKCNYNVTRRHLLHQHMKVHTLGKAEFIELDDLDDLSSSNNPSPAPLTDSQSSPPSPISTPTPTTTTMVDIPQIWVSRGGKFSKMYKCRHCPHVNIRKVNIQEHEKMHLGSGDSGSKPEGEHHCTQCDYVCNNAGVLSSHIKVHQGAFGILHCLVDPHKSDEDQIRTLTLSLHQLPKYQQLGILPPLPSASMDEVGLDILPAEQDDEVLEPPTDVNLANSLAGSGDMLFFCHECPARFLKAKEFDIHRKLHGGRLFYKCDWCSYTGRQRPHLNSHAMVHTTEYKKRTATLRAIYPTHPGHPAPIVTYAHPDSDCWMVANASTGAGTPGSSTNDVVELDSDTDINDNNIHTDADGTGNRTILGESLMRSTRNTFSSSKDFHVPLSGTDLFRHRQTAIDAAETQLRLAEGTSTNVQSKDNLKRLGMDEEDEESLEQPDSDGQETFGAGNPDFIYPMCTKNGRQKEKRYKCAKCPTAFEKREQYKVHLGLHGSKQRFQCEECDYSVPNSSNFVQHQRKHVIHKDALASASNTTPATTNEPENQQTKTIQQQQMFRCTNCPYTSRRRDAVDNHLKRHASVSGTPRQAHTCEHCDYSVAQAHILRDHVKMHFAARPQAEVFLSPDIDVKVKESDDRVIFDDKSSGDKDSTGASDDISDKSDSAIDDDGKTVE